MYGSRRHSMPYLYTVCKDDETQRSKRMYRMIGMCSGYLDNYIPRHLDGKAPEQESKKVHMKGGMGVVLTPCITEKPAFGKLLS